MITFEVKGDLAKVQDLELDANFEELTEWLDDELKGYKTLVVLPDNLAAAKADRARIRKIASRIDEQRKLVKKAYMQPYTAFEEKCKKPIALCREVIDHIDAQIKNFEEEIRGKKEQDLRDYFTEKAAEMELTAYAEWSAIFNPRWLNSTYDISKAQSDIDENLGNIADAVAVIRTQNEKYVPMALEHLAKSMDLYGTLSLIKRWELAEKTEAARRAQLEERKTEQTIAPVSAPERTEQPVIEKAPPEEKVYTLGFKVRCTEAQLNDLKAFLENRGIAYGPI